MNVILSTYLTAKLDPQRHTQWPKDDYSKIDAWKSSIEALNLQGVIFHDCLSEEFVKEYTSDNIKFIKCIDDYEWSTNDFRFLLYNHYLNAHKEIDLVFMTDVSDVKVVMDPFEQIEKHNEREKIFVGLDNAGIIATAPWSRMEHYGYIPKYTPLWQTLKHPVVNAGALGGTRQNMIDYTQYMVNEFNEINVPGKNNNMAVFNFVAYHFYKDNLVYGAPVTSNFSRFENDREDVWFIHK